jgi:hypothetical protein
MDSHQRYLQYLLEKLVMDEDRARKIIEITYDDDSLCVLDKKYFLMAHSSIPDHACKCVDGNLSPKSFSTVSSGSSISSAETIDLDDDNYITITYNENGTPICTKDANGKIIWSCDSEG